MNTKYLIFIALISLTFSLNAQVGISTTNPKATLDVVGNANTPTVVDGVIMPSLTGDQLKDKDSVYGSDQKGTMVYITAAVGTASTKTINVIEEGYYFFDGVLWHEIKTTKTITYKGGANMYLSSINASTGQVTTLNQTVGNAVTPATNGTFTVAVTGAYVMHIKPTSTGTGQCRLGVNDGTGTYRNINYYYHYNEGVLQSAGSSNVITLNAGTTYRIQTPPSVTMHQECFTIASLSDVRNNSTYISIFLLGEL